MRLVILGIIISFISHLFFPASAAAATCDEWVAKATAVEGSVEVRRSGQAQWAPVQKDAVFCPGDMIRVLDWSRLEIVAQNDTGESMSSSPVISGGTIYLRTFDALWAIRKQ